MKVIMFSLEMKNANSNLLNFKLAHNIPQNNSQSIPHMEYTRGIQIAVEFPENVWFDKIISSTSTWILGQFDYSVIILEILMVIFVLSRNFNLQSITTSLTSPILDLSVMAQFRNISLGELLAFLTPALGFMILDFLGALGEDDPFENVGFGLILGLGLGAIFVLVLVDIQYFYTSSAASSGESGIRVIYNDLTSNLLCCTRIGFCWIRYLFYELQAELVDTSLFYAETNDVNFESAELNLNMEFDGQLQLYQISWSLGLDLIHIAIEIALLGCDLTFGLLKLGLALYLYWLLFDLLILRSAAFVESKIINSRHLSTSKIRRKKLKVWQWEYPYYR